MDHSELIHKIALSSDNKELGKIFRFDDLLGKTAKKLKPHVIIRVVRMFKNDISIALDMELFIKTEERFVWFDITRKKFNQIEKIQRRIRNKGENKPEYIPETLFLGSRGGYGYHRIKNRRK